MAITATQISTGTVATQVFTPNNAAVNDLTPGWITNTGTSGTLVYLGGSSVTTALGYPLVGGSGISVALLGNDTVYAISAATQTVAVMKGRQ